VKQKQIEAIYQRSDDPRVNSVRALAIQLRNGAELTPELQEAISDLNAEACKNFNRAEGPSPEASA
jgi:hypothetical protein